MDQSRTAHLDKRDAQSSAPRHYGKFVVSSFVIGYCYCIEAYFAALTDRVGHMMTRLNRGFWISAALAIMSAPAMAQLSVEQLNGKRVTFTIVRNVSGVNARGPFTGAISTLTGQMQISGGSISGSMTRVVTYQGRPVGTLSANLSGAIGKPQQGVNGGNYVWLLQGNALTMLRTFAVGGMRITITFNGAGCSVQAPMMQEVGAGNSRMRSAIGGQVEVTSATLVSTSCTIGG